ncbi:hypothetical protein LGN22_26690 [Burkholderia cenocepacia]|uniref:Uncharacterized protein n=1 Tax=Burkholderia cenocepacia TaxID=95486 RepID=A0AAW4TMD1_9BURK|nr:hypothetical protein [Burkholderia cenocepacia]MCA8382498.1 hypothetical protein [Burkholderia cenocepacia]
MEMTEAADVIEAMAASLRAQPKQFHFNVHAKAIGMQSVSYGGIGTQISVTGGARGSQTTGVRASASTGDVQIAIQAANGEIDTQMQQLIETLDQIAKQLRSKDPDKKWLAAAKDAFHDWVPPIITGVASTLIAHAIGA